MSRMIEVDSCFGCPNSTVISNIFEDQTLVCENLNKKLMTVNISNYKKLNEYGIDKDCPLDRL